MQLPEWTSTIIIGAITTVMGAGVTYAVGLYQNRRPRVQTRISRTPIFPRTVSGVKLEAVLLVSHEGKDHSLRNLTVVEITLRNAGTKDFDSMEVGINLAEGDKAAIAEVVAPDRKHSATISHAISPESQCGNIDVTMRPFNRGDVYSLQLFVVRSLEGKVGDPKLVSNQPVVFREAPEYPKGLEEAAIKLVALGVFLCVSYVILSIVGHTIPSSVPPPGARKGAAQVTTGPPSAHKGSGPVTSDSPKGT